MNRRIDSPVVSVIVPVFNVERYIRQCIDSILAQEYSKIELVLVDDKSSDRSGIICDEYAKINKNVRVVHSTVNQGLGLTRNIGIAHAAGDYVTFIDSDDFIEKNHINVLMNTLINNNADVCYGGFTGYDGNSYIKHPNVLSGSIVTGQRIFHEIIPAMCGRAKNSEAIQMSSCMAIYSKNIIDKHNICFYSEREYISEDLLFNIEVLKHSSIVAFSDDVGYYYRYNPTSLSHSYRIDRLEKQVKLAKMVSKITLEMGVYEKAKTRIVNTLLSWSRYCAQMEQARWHEIGFKESLKMIKGICNDPDIIEYSHLYVKGNDKRSSEILNNLIRKKQSFLLWCVMAVKNIKH